LDRNVAIFCERLLSMSVVGVNACRRVMPSRIVPVGKETERKRPLALGLEQPEGDPHVRLRLHDALLPSELAEIFRFPQFHGGVMTTGGCRDSIQAEATSKRLAGVLLPLAKTAGVVLTIGKLPGVLGVDPLQIGDNVWRVSVRPGILAAEDPRWT
jgi:hypothetical protein